MESESRISPEVVAGRLRVRRGDTVDIRTLQNNAALVYGMGDFERVDLQMKKQNDGYALIVKAKEKTWARTISASALPSKATSKEAADTISSSITQGGG